MAEVTKILASNPPTGRASATAPGGGHLCRIAKRAPSHLSHLRATKLPTKWVECMADGRCVTYPPSKKHTFGDASWSSSPAASQDRLGRCALTHRIRHGRVTKQHRILIAKRVVDQLSGEAWPNAPNSVFFGEDLPPGLRCVKSVVGGVFATCRNPKVLRRPADCRLIQPRYWRHHAIWQDNQWLPQRGLREPALFQRVIMTFSSFDTANTQVDPWTTSGKHSYF